MLKAVIKNGVLAIVAGLAITGAMLLALKLTANEIAWYFYLIVGIVCAGIAFGIGFLAFKPNDVTLARVLDNDFGLHEKVQTMVENTQNSGIMIETQREDTQEKLGNLPKQKVRFSRIWGYILSAVLSAAIFVTSIMIPAKVKPEPELPPELQIHQLGEFEKRSLVELASEIRRSNLKDELKENVAVVVDDLAIELAEYRLIDLQDTVFAAIARVDALILSQNTYRSIYSALTGDIVKSLANLIRTIPMSYKTTEAITSYEEVTRIGNSLDGSVEENIKGKMQAILNSFPKTSAQALADGAYAYATALIPALEVLSAFEPTAIYNGMIAFNVGVQKAFDLQQMNYDFETVFEQLEITFGGLQDVLVDTLKTETYNNMMDEYVRNRLAAIFGYTLDQIPAVPSLGGNGSGTGGGIGENGDAPDDDNEGTGGGGNKEGLFGGNAMVYNPETQKYESYGDVFLSDYYAKLFNLLQDENVSEEMKMYIRNYIHLLLVGPEETAKANN